MNRKNDSMLTKVRTLVKQKGQGIVEYTLLLAFVVGIAMMLNGANLGSAVKDTFDKVASVLGEVKDYADSGAKDYAYALKNWSKLSQEDLKKISNDDRVLADQEALGNIGEFFVGMKRSELTNYLKINNPKNSPLTHLREENDFGTDDGNGNLSYNWNYSSDNRYLFSNYAVTNKGTDKDDKVNYGNGIKLTLEYEKIDNVEYVKSAKVVIDQQSIDDKMKSNKGNGDPRLAITVKKDGNGNIVKEETYKNWIANNSDKLEH